MSRRVGILGGMFDPIHRGHIDVAASAELALELTQIFVVPASVPPHRSQPVASSFHRFAMVALAVAGRPGWRASDIELLAEAPSYTSSTLGTFHESGYHPSELFFVVGADAFLEIDTWKDYPRILDLAHFAVVSRPGCPAAELRNRLPHLAPRMASIPIPPTSRIDPLIILIDVPTADVSSTAIRIRCAEGRSITGMVDAAVQQHIEQHGLYAPMVLSNPPTDQPPNVAAGRLHGKH